MTENLLVLMPSYGVIERETEELVRALVGRGAELLETHGLGLIDRVRSELASRALERKHTRWLWLDADTAMMPGGVDHLLEVAERDDLDLLSGVYMTRQPGGRPACVFDQDSQRWPHASRSTVVYGQQGGLYPLRRVGFGAVVTHRRVFERASVACKPVDFSPTSSGWAFFLPEVQGRDYIGEDYSFCDRARATGSTLWADTRVRVGHVGRYVYRWEDAQRIDPVPTLEMHLE